MTKDIEPMSALLLRISMELLVSKDSSFVAGHGNEEFVVWANAEPLTKAHIEITARIIMRLLIIAFSCLTLRAFHQSRARTLPPV